MDKPEVVQRVAERTGLSRSQASKAVDALLETITDSLVRGEQVRFIGFGSFQVRSRSQREGRNPRTGAKLQIPSQRVPAFSAGAKLSQAVRGGEGGQG
jgi:DNA-binding protein HU-beta